MKKRFENAKTYLKEHAPEIVEAGAVFVAVVYVIVKAAETSKKNSAAMSEIARHVKEIDKELKWQYDKRAEFRDQTRGIIDRAKYKNVPFEYYPGIGVRIENMAEALKD